MRVHPDICGPQTERCRRLIGGDHHHREGNKCDQADGINLPCSVIHVRQNSSESRRPRQRSVWAQQCALAVVSVLLVLAALLFLVVMAFRQTQQTCEGKTSDIEVGRHKTLGFSTEWQVLMNADIATLHNANKRQVRACCCAPPAVQNIAVNLPSVQFTNASSARFVQSHSVYVCVCALLARGRGPAVVPIHTGFITP